MADIIIRNIPNDTHARDWAELAVHAAVSHACSLPAVGRHAGTVWTLNEGRPSERYLYTYTTPSGTVVARFQPKEDDNG